MKLKTAKKLTAGALALSMMFAMAVPMAFAESEVAPSTAPHITKKYTATNTGTISPKETFTFTAAATDVKNAGVKADGRTPITKADAPTLTIEAADYGTGSATTAGATMDLEITKDKDFPNVGIYYYTVTEAASGNAGVTTHAGNMLLKVSVVYNEAGTALEEKYVFYNGMDSTTGEGTKGTKGAAIENTYSAGSLEVKKVVTGNLGDKNKKFNVTVTFTAPAGKTVAENISYVEGGETKTIVPSDWKASENGIVAKAEIAVAHNDTITFTNIPYDVTYTVVEDDYTKAADGTTKDYDEAQYAAVDSDTEKGTVGKIDTAKETMTITNNKGDNHIDTGVILDNAPYILMLAVVAGGAMTLVIKKRREEE